MRSDVARQRTRQSRDVCWSPARNHAPPSHNLRSNNPWTRARILGDPCWPPFEPWAVVVGEGDASGSLLPFLSPRANALPWFTVALRKDGWGLGDVHKYPSLNESRSTAHEENLGGFGHHPFDSDASLKIFLTKWARASIWVLVNARARRTVSDTQAPWLSYGGGQVRAGLRCLGGPKCASCSAGTRFSTQELFFLFSFFYFLFSSFIFNFQIQARFKFWFWTQNATKNKISSMMHTFKFYLAFI